MPTAPCLDCGAQVSTIAPVCPHCGRPDPTHPTQSTTGPVVQPGVGGSVAGGLPSSLTLATMWAVGFVGVAYAMYSVVNMFHWFAWQTWSDATGSFETSAAADGLLSYIDLVPAIAGLLIAVQVAVGVLVVVWLFKAYRAFQFEFQARRWSAGWAVGSWFIPVAQFVIPKLVINEIDRMSQASAAARSGVAWRQYPRSAVSDLWWAAWVVGILVTQGSVSVWNSADPASGSYGGAVAGMIAGAVLMSVAAVAGLSTIRLFAQRLKFPIPQIGESQNPSASLSTQVPEHSLSTGAFVAMIGVLVVAAFVTAYLILTAGSGDEIVAAPSVSTGTSAATISTSSTTTLLDTPAGATWRLPDYDGSVLVGGSASPALPGNLVEYQSFGDEGDLYLVVGGTPTYIIVEGICLDPDCDEGLTYGNDGSEFYWFIDGSTDEGTSDLSDALYFTTKTGDEFVSACWSEAFDGPVVAVASGALTPILEQAWVFIGDLAGGSWFGLEPSLINPTKVLVLPSEGNDLPGCGDAVDVALRRASAAQFLFGEGIGWDGWRDERGVVTDALIGAAITWDDLSILIDGEPAGLDVIGGGCANEDCSVNLTYAVPDGNWDRAVWWAFDDRGNASQALGFELMAGEGESLVCWSSVHDSAVVYTTSIGSPSVPQRAWFLGDELTWFLSDPLDLDPSFTSSGRGQLGGC